MENKKSVKNIIIGIIGGGVILSLLVCFIVAYNNTKISDNKAIVTKENSENNVNNSDNVTNLNNKVSTTLDSKNSKITSDGTYDLSGEYESIIVNTSGDVTLNLNGVTITNSSGPAINIEKAKKVTIVLSGTNKITSTTTEDLDGAIYSKADLVFSGTGSIEVKSNYDGIVSKDTLVIKNGTYTINSDDDGIRGKDSVEISNGTFTINAGGDGIKSTNDEDSSLGYINITGGTYNITSYNDGIQAETNLTIKDGEFIIKTTDTSSSDSAKGLKAGNLITIDGGKYDINATDDGIHSNINITINNGKFDITAKDDGIHADGIVEINNGTFSIKAAEGIEATYVKLNDGNININATDDGINAGQKSEIGTPTIEINGGDITITMAQGDTDGVDSNGDIIINGGTISVTGQSTFDYDGTGTINGGTVICNGEQVTTLPNQFMGGGAKGGMPGGMTMNNLRQVR